MWRNNFQVLMTSSKFFACFRFFLDLLAGLYVREPIAETIDFILVEICFVENSKSTFWIVQGI